LSHSILWFLGVQLIIIALGVIIKLIDYDDRLVVMLPFEKIAKVSGFFPAFQHYWFTYYFAGLVVFLLLTGLLVIGVGCCGVTPPMRECGVCVEGCQLCCMACNPLELCRCADIPAVGFAECCQVLLVASGPEALLLVGLLVAVAVLIIGLLAALATLVLIVQRVVQRYVRLKEMGLLAEEYYVKDLAAPQVDDEGAAVQQQMEQGLPAEPQQLSETSQEEIQKLVEEELRAIFGGALPRSSTAAPSGGNAGGYGSMGSTRDYRGG